MSNLAETTYYIKMYRWGGWGAYSFIVSNSTAAKWHEDGPFVATAENVALAGRDVGIFGMGVLTAYVPTGIVSVPAA